MKKLVLLALAMLVTAALFAAAWRDSKPSQNAAAWRDRAPAQVDAAWES